MEYVHLKKVHLFFYSKDSNNNYNVLLYKNIKEELYQHPFNDITNYDNGSIYSISRFLTKNFSNILTDDFISKLQSKSDFEIKNENKNLKQYELWENEVFLFWLDKLSKNPIQYDSINEEIIYFIEIPYISIDSLNSLLEKNNIEYRFIYINETNFSSLKFSNETTKLFNLLPLDKMIKHILYILYYHLKHQEKTKMDFSIFLLYFIAYIGKIMKNGNILMFPLMVFLLKNYYQKQKLY